MENITTILLEDEMKKSYMDYSSEVITNRALPDVRDGLKPVHRRILHSMNELGLVNSKPYKKCARIVGEVLGKYHPHGDRAVYEALVILAQDFSTKYPLVDGHGNFGSIDGDSAAAMRYTEARMAKITNELLKDIDKNTVDFIPNFDGEELEPCILPSRFPSLLVNGSSGIAVGMATEIPPHNLADTIDCVIKQIENPDIEIDELIDILKAPDFPTGGVIINPKEVKKIYKDGKGTITIRSKYYIENNKIIITEIPFKVNKTKLLDSLTDLMEERIIYKKSKSGKMIEDKRLDPILPEMIDVVDESDREGMRIVLEFKKSFNVDKVLNILFKHTNLQSNFSANFTAVYKNKPLEHMDLKTINQYYINHQKEVITKRTKYNIDKLTRRKHILEGYLIALNNVDKIVKIIKNSKNKEDAKVSLISVFNFTEIQALSVLDLKLQRLTALETEDIKNENKNIGENLENLQMILDDENVLLNVLIEELNEIKEKYKDTRKTELKEMDTHIQKIVQEYGCRIVYTDNFIKKVTIKSTAHRFKEGEEMLGDIKSNNTDSLLLFTNKTNRYKLSVDALGEPVKPSNIGDKTSNIIDLEADEKVIKIVSIPEAPKGYIVSVFKNGNIAKVDINSFMSNYTKLNNCYSTSNELLDIQYIDRDCNILLVSSEGKGLIIDTSKLSAKKSKNVDGVTGIKLEEGLTCIGCVIDVTKDINITLVTSKREDKFFMMNDVSINENKSWFDYLKGNPNRQGNFIYNCRSKNNSIKLLKKEK